MGGKVCILTTVHPPFDTRIFHKEAKTLAKAGYDVTLVAQHDRNEVVDGVRIIALPRPRNRLIRMFGLSWRVFRLALRERADVYHFHDPELLGVGSLLKLTTAAKVIYDVHEDVPRQIVTKYWIPAILRHPTARVVGLLEKLVAPRLDAVVAATESVADPFQHSQLTVVHNYPDLEMLHGFPTPATCDAKAFVHIGAISRFRGAVEMVRALEYLEESHEVRLELIGRFEPPALEAELRLLSGYSQVHFTNWLPWREAWQCAQGVLAGLVLFHPGPNHTKSLPNKLFEYMAIGLPVIASDFPLWQDIIERQRCGLTVNPRDPASIARAMGYFLDYPEDAKKMGRRGRRAVQTEYNWDPESRKLLDLYARLLYQRGM